MDPMTATKPPVKLKPPEPDDPAVVLTVAELSQISALLRRNLHDKEGLLQAIRIASTFKLDGISINLEPRLLQRLKTRCLVKDFPGFLRDVIIKQLHDYAGY